MTWRMAKSLEVLREQINNASPNRSKSSDGGIGNAEHASRSSDHNPWVKDPATGDGIVTARDFTNDPAHGINSEELANRLLASRDPRIKYIISNRKIASGDAGPSPWKWRPYSGANPHNHHFHISVKSDKSNYDSMAPWSFDLSPSAAELVVKPAEPEEPILREGSTGKDVARLQSLLNGQGATLKEDGGFGELTKKAVETFQKSHALIADGVVGKYTWEALTGKA